MEKPDSIAVRAMAEDDLASVTRLYRDMYDEQQSMGMVMAFNHEEIADMLAAQLKSKLFVQAVAELEGRVQGFAIGSMVRVPKKYALPEASVPFLGFIHDVYVSPPLRGTGTAVELTQALETHFAREGIRYVELHVLSGNERGKRFWSANGYQDVIQVMYKHL